MRPLVAVAPPTPRGASWTLAGADRLRGQLASMSRSPAFWRSLAMVLAITLVHFAASTIERPSPFVDLPDVVILLYAFPIIYASTSAPPAGGLVMALICVLFSLPVIFGEALAYSHESLQWLAELIYETTSLVVALVISRVVDLRAEEQRRAQEMAERLASLRQQMIKLSLQAQELERGRIARELHDETIQSLISLCQGLDHLTESGRQSGRTMGSLKQLRAQAERTVGEVRRLSRGLRPSLLDDLGLVTAVQCLVAELVQTQGIRADVQVLGQQRRLPTDTELNLFRIVQEALSNVAKHALAATASVSLEFGESDLRIVVTDDGVGFPSGESPSSLMSAGKLGLVGMRERASLVGADLVVESKAGQGTRVTVVLEDARQPAIRGGEAVRTLGRELVGPCLEESAVARNR